MTDYKQLCAELVDAIDSGIPTDRMHLSPLMLRARAALAAPEPEGPTDEELLEEWRQLMGAPKAVLAQPMLDFARAVLARWGRPAPVPVAVSEHPWERDGWCHPEERWAWFYNWRVGWRDAIPPESLKPPTLFPYTHSLPFNALPLPSREDRP